ncbi:protease IV, 67K long form [Crocosphaera subtropica ATCC 51142]|uniref:Protease 4 n=1 Tax=Crocosphaera subtropica (strain ATCC 51142 / BH68) TaxID=43989 RepID=B1WSH4_CROS5|nr:signal peptide peptidase SppA [Crocosphaera subtropica]ACB51960.1 protease IV, 67K long form [Crocosphaera subtropica ATCC 51142]
MMNFVKQTLASLIGTLAGLFLFTTAGVSSVVILLITLASVDSEPTIKDQSVLVFDLSTEIKDREPLVNIGDILSGKESSVLTLSQVIKNIEKASKDDRIKAIFLDGSNASSGSGYANFSEIRQALIEFKESGKKIIAYDVTISEQEYYLTSLADTLIVNPMGLMEFNGIGTEPLFLTGALNKYGIGVQVVRVGEYKSGVEPYTRTQLSPENRQQLEVLLGNIWNNFLQDVGKTRQIKVNNLQSIADTQGLLYPQEAKELNLVDQVDYRDKAISILKEITDNKEESLRQISFNNYVNIPVTGITESSSNNKIAVVYLEGAIVDGVGNREQVGATRFARILRKIRDNEQVKAVVIRINSPGGSATASDIILREIQLIQETKPVIISMGNVAASGGYWIATGGEHIFAQPNTITGSIGVFGVLFNIQEIANNNGITWDVVKTGKFADLGTATRPKTEQELAIYQKSVNRVYDLFLEKVAKSRDLSKEKVVNIAQGRVWSGETAKKIGLVDSFGGLGAAIDYAVEKTELGKDWQVEEYPTSQGFAELFIKKTLDEDIKITTNTVDPLTEEFLKFKEELKVIQNFNDPRGVYSLLPFNWQLR